MFTAYRLRCSGSVKLQFKVGVRGFAGAHFGQLVALQDERAVVRLFFSPHRGLGGLRVEEVGKCEERAVKPLEGYFTSSFVGSAHQVVVAAYESPLLRAECGTATDDEGRLDDVDGG